MADPADPGMELAALREAVAVLQAEVAELRVQQHLVAQSLTVVDAHGRPCAVLAGSELGGLAHLLDAAGNVVVSFGVSASGGYVAIVAPDGALRVSLTGDPDGGMLLAHAPDGEAVALVQAGAEGGWLTARATGGENAAELRPSVSELREVTTGEGKRPTMKVENADADD